MRAAAPDGQRRKSELEICEQGRETARREEKGDSRPNGPSLNQQCQGCPWVLALEGSERARSRDPRPAARGALVRDGHVLPLGFAVQCRWLLVAVVQANAQTAGPQQPHQISQFSTL